MSRFGHVYTSVSERVNNEIWTTAVEGLFNFPEKVDFDADRSFYELRKMFESFFCSQ